ncbi:uncharacterized protein A4U43_C02F19040 [Asparagus officinalis]|uniref:Structural maintenance of chromosomes protein 5 n=1 Tax=Asparagus officinalis TaxID=4686 RepID=A0A5P1FL60_ASPOF|nr:uncharacterized protein A4U43_C02F19040 [Asparagus officinalis]
MADRSAKRRKIPPSDADRRGEDDYLPGNIVEIEIHNFMTYDHLICRPASRLNLVIGPNGSGKSSLVCAIALGLGGEPQILGRAASIGAFVKRGEERGYIKISLRGFTAEDKVTIARKIDTHNKSEWMLNGVAAPKRDVVEIIQKFNIQVNNLTQFLPQDRVCEFAKLTPIQLLEETEKAVGDPELPVQHHALVDKSHALKRLEVTVKQNRETLNQLKALNAEQEKDVKRVRQRNQLLKKAELMKKKLPWLKYDLKKTEYQDAKKRETESKKKLDEAAKILSDLKAPIEEKRKTKAIHESSSKKINNQINLNAKRRSENLEMEAKMAIQVRAKYTDMDDLKRQEESRLQRMVRAKEDLITAERELEELPVYKPPKDELERLGTQILDLELSAKQLRMHGREKEQLLQQRKFSLMQNKDRLKEMENSNNKLLQALQRCGADKIFEAYNWVQEHRNELRKEVYGPVLLEVTVPNRSHTAYLESHVPNYIWKVYFLFHAQVHAFSLLLFVNVVTAAGVDISGIENLKSKKTELENTIAELEESLRVLHAEQRQLEDEAAKLQRDRESIHKRNNDEKRKRREMESRVEQRRRKLEALMGDEDLTSATQKLIDQTVQLNEQRFQLAMKIKSLLIEAISLKWSFAEKQMTSIEFDTKIREMEADLKQQEKFALNAATHYENCKKDTEDYRQQLFDAKRHAESVAIITEDLAKEFLEMPATIEELEASIQDNISEANSILFLNQNILQEYESRQRKIESMETKVEADQQELDRCLSEINTLKCLWLPTLRNLVVRINETFSRNFQEMAVAGEVLLDEHETDFDKYGILIKVKFRESGQLQVLSAHHQSGGERSVSTILYLVSLQDLTNCPFRVVDEINQGMDPVNERKMFQQLVRAASQENTPQCFLLTPKLLPDLEYSDACSILNIMNGPYIEKPSQVWSCGENWGTVIGLVGEGLS